MRITFKKLFLLLIVIKTSLLFPSCNTDKVIELNKEQPENGENIHLSVNIPRNSVPTYAGVDGTVDENHIDTLFINILEDGVIKETKKFYGTELQTVSASNDSIVNVSFELDNLSGGKITAEVFANRMEIVPITNEIALPDRNLPQTCFLMSGKDSLRYNGTAYSGTVQVVRNVAKLRVLVNKHVACLPANLIVDYSNISVEMQQVPDRTQLFQPTPITTPPGLTYINYSARTGTALRPSAPIASFTGGQIDSMYLNENFLNNGDYTAGNITQIKVSIPTQVPSMPVKTAEYTYQLYTGGSHQIKRNHIYTLDIKITGQSLEPQITLDLIPWEDVRVSGDINGSTLFLNKSVVSLNPINTRDSAVIVNYTTDNSSISLDWSKVNPAHNIDTTVAFIQGRNGEINIFWNGDGAPDFGFKDTLYVTAGNIIKAVILEYNIPSGNFGEWVGTFHRWNQTGERIIKIRNKGTWTANVTQGADFIILDAENTTDTGWGTSTADLGNDAGFDTSHPVSGTATTLSGSGIIYFRVGLKSTLDYVGAPPRYGLIEVVTDEGTRRIFVRQGEEADFVMKPSDANPANGGAARPYAVKFSPYNLADPLRRTGGADTANHSRMSYADAVFNSNKFVDYPSQAGYFFPWNSSGEYSVTLGYNRAYHPVNPTGAITNLEYFFAPVTWSRNMEPCPAGYRHPKDSLQSVVTSEMRQSLFYTPNNNIDIYGSTPGGNLDNSLWGFYADGFFDRLPVVTSPNGADSTTVSYHTANLADPRNTGVAYIGRLIYNPTTYASLFMPAAGARNGGSGMGPLKGAGQAGMYWTATNYVTAEPAPASEWAVAFYFTPTAFYGYYSYEATLVPSGISVRCVKSDFGLPGSM